MTESRHLSLHPSLHLSDEDLQSLAEADQAQVTVPPHLAVCGACRDAVTAYHRMGREVAAAPRSLPPLDFTAAVLARLPPTPPALSADDLAAVVLAAGAAFAAAILFVRADGVSQLFDLVASLPGRALTEAVVAASLQGREQIALLLCLTASALIVGAALWRVLSRARRVIA